jgi:hypothetical protein
MAWRGAAWQGEARRWVEMATSSLYLIVRSPTTAVGTGDLPPTRHSAYLVDLQEDETVDQAVHRSITPGMLGRELIAFDQESGARYRVGPSVELVAEESGS